MAKGTQQSGSPRESGAAEPDKRIDSPNGADQQRSHENYGFEETGAPPEKVQTNDEEEDTQKRPGSYGKIATRGGHRGDGWTLQRGRREERGEQDQEQASYGQGSFSRDGQGEFGTNDFGEPGFGQEEYRRGSSGQGGYTDRSQQQGDFATGQPSDDGPSQPVNGDDSELRS